MIFVLLLPVFLMVTHHERASGIYVRLVPRHQPVVDEACLLGPVVVTLKRHGPETQLLLDGAEVSSDKLEDAIKSQLAPRANWEIFVEGDESVSFQDSMFVVDAVNALHAKTVILTPGLMKQMAKGCVLP